MDTSWFPSWCSAMRTAWICTQCQAGSVRDFAHVLRDEHERFTAHRTETVDPRLTNEMLGDIVLRERFTEFDFPSLGEGVPQLVIGADRALGGEQPGEGDLPERAAEPTWLVLCEALARHLHRDDVDKQGEPYIGHLERVEARFPSVLHYARGAAWLHDVLEMGRISGLDSLYGVGIPHEVVATVDELTREMGETYDAYIHRLAASATATLVKLADLEDNLDTSRGPIPGDLARRYERARRYLLKIQEARV